MVIYWDSSRDFPTRGPLWSQSYFFLGAPLALFPPFEGLLPRQRSECRRRWGSVDVTKVISSVAGISARAPVDRVAGSSALAAPSYPVVASPANTYDSCWHGFFVRGYSYLVFLWPQVASSWLLSCFFSSFAAKFWEVDAFFFFYSLLSSHSGPWLASWGLGGLLGPRLQGFDFKLLWRSVRCFSRQVRWLCRLCHNYSSEHGAGKWLVPLWAFCRLEGREGGVLARFATCRGSALFCMYVCVSFPPFF